MKLATPLAWLCFLLVLAACRDADAQVGAILQGDWRLVKIGEKTLDEKPLDEGIDPPYLKVLKDGSVSGSTGVNRLFGGLADEGDLLFGPLATSRRAGPPAAMKIESAFVAALGKATDFCRGKDKLQLLDADDKVLLTFAARREKE